MIESLIFWIVIILFSVTAHELCHGLVAFWLGDKTAYQAGRLTLNPLKHIDPFWTILMPAFFFIATGGRFAIGMAKPVPVNYANLYSPRRDMILVAISGPIANLILASLLTFLFRLTGFEPLLYAVYFNLGLAVFNLLPIPPLDGSRLISGLLPARLAYYYDLTEKVGFFIVLLLYFSGLLWAFILPGMNFFAALLDIPTLGFGK
jgi:Zn-dependent protease